MKSNIRWKILSLMALLVTALLGSTGWASDVKPSVTNTFAYFLVTSQTEGDSIAQFQIDSNGKLKALNPPTVPVADNLISLTVSPDGNYLFALNDANQALGIPGTFFRFLINNDGTLAPNPVTSTGPIGHAYAFTLSPNGKFALVPSENSVISYRISDAGEFTMVSTVASGQNACTVAIDPSGKFAYVGNFIDQTISEYKIGSNGKLKSNGLVSTAPNSVYLLNFAPEGFLYSSGCCTLAGLAEYSIDSSSGTISQLDPFTIGHLPWSFAFNPTGTYAYTANADSGRISLSSLTLSQTTGTLAKNGLDIPLSGGWAGQIAVDPSGKFAFFAQIYVPGNQPGIIHMFKINRLGKLAANGTISLDVGVNETSGLVAFAQR
jgi:6-phosphogluconolactonase (cycloisomerase 2 family)